VKIPGEQKVALFSSTDKPRIVIPNEVRNLLFDAAAKNRFLVAMLLGMTISRV
jgi:hypothetical protein